MKKITVTFEVSDKTTTEQLHAELVNMIEDSNSEVTSNIGSVHSYPEVQQKAHDALDVLMSSTNIEGSFGVVLHDTTSDEEEGTTTDIFYSLNIGLVPTINPGDIEVRRITFTEDGEAISDTIRSINGEEF